MKTFLILFFLFLFIPKLSYSVTTWNCGYNNPNYPGLLCGHDGLREVYTGNYVEGNPIWVDVMYNVPVWNACSFAPSVTDLHQYGYPAGCTVTTSVVNPQWTPTMPLGWRGNWNTFATGEIWSTYSSDCWKTPGYTDPAYWQPVQESANQYLCKGYTEGSTQQSFCPNEIWHHVYDDNWQIISNYRTCGCGSGTYNYNTHNCDCPYAQKFSSTAMACVTCKEYNSVYPIYDPETTNCVASVGACTDTLGWDWMFDFGGVCAQCYDVGYPDEPDWSSGHEIAWYPYIQPVLLFDGHTPVDGDLFTYSDGFSFSAGDWGTISGPSGVYDGDIQKEYQYCLLDHHGSNGLTWAGPYNPGQFPYIKDRLTYGNHSAYINLVNTPVQGLDMTYEFDSYFKSYCGDRRYMQDKWTFDTVLNFDSVTVTGGKDQYVLCFEGWAYHAPCYAWTYGGEICVIGEGLDSKIVSKGLYTDISGVVQKSTYINNKGIIGGHEIHIP